PSADLKHELAQCHDCHGTLSEMDAVHKPHDGSLECSDCHAVHEMNVGQKPTCETCHDDGRTPASILKK
ncbi:MAG: cytochrome c3 family protein, partial [Shewanella sp.]